MEWNQNIRLIGFFGDPNQTEAEEKQLEYSALEPLETMDPRRQIGVRENRPLDPSADILFELREDQRPA